MAAPNMEVFDSYFRRADLDGDGRISGTEAVSFFQGSNLPKHVLAQVWMHADQNRTGFLGRTEFYNALKLVTVAQSGRELTPDMVKAALFGPAAAKIPAPQINPLPVAAAQASSISTPTPQLGPMSPSPTQMGVMAPTHQNFGGRGPQVPSNMGINHQAPLAPNNHFMRPPQATPIATSFSVQGVNQGLYGGGNLTGQRPPSSNTPSLSTDWLGSSTSGASVGGVSLSATTPVLPPKPQAPSMPATSVSMRPSNPVLSSLQPAVVSKALVLSGNGFSSDSVFGGDSFSASQAKSGILTSSFSASTVANASVASSLTPGSQNSNKPVQSDPFQSISALPRGSSHLQQAQSQNQNQPDMKQNTSVLSASNISVGSVSTAASQTQPQWPKIKQSDIKKYTNVFVEVDKDRDGKISGQQARNLFLSWRLPREVLKQVWDLSDQDNDSMLSLREFCIALYLMERYREGRPLPSVLPNSLMYDETLLRATGQPSAAYGGLSQQGIPGARPLMLASGVRPPVQTSVTSLATGALQPSQHNTRGPLYGKNLPNQSKEEHDISNSKFEEVTNEVNKVQEVEKILDSREKIEFYRTKMQELVLYKSRCDNKLNEIMERASADKHEVESLAKKYEEKYKQVADVASKLTIEEATFRDIQERKLELQNALVKMEQGGSIDGLLQVRADRIQSDLEELAKALSERCKHHGINVKTTTSIELPFGWQPGIQEGAVDWDEEWDKFEDEGFSIAKELSVGAENVAEPAQKSPSSWTEEASPFATSSHVYSNSGDRFAENGSAFDHSEDGSARSPPGSPGRYAFESPKEFHSPIHDLSPHAKDSHSDHGGSESIFSGDKFVDESWGAAFDTNDDVDSVWGFNAKDSGQNSFYDSGDFGLNPIKVGSPSASSEFGVEKKSPFFADSVPSSPLFNSASPRFSEGSGSHSFDTSSRFDSFSMRESGSFQQRENFTRFDSIRSTSDFDHSRGFSFDDTDPFGSSGPFKTTETPRKTSDNWNAF
ncbi:epidermal growth factor receptor substrate 15-like [Iris pallida]|uniref:Epidermal growth factor receptor substrate 15-like n=1 Tax=Iris pallida TaxID=29817 RepID=A0AAX6G3R9_IRIPA|nr:epidermal growth factor receptor substrate 15-like [Iris pallida]